MRRQTGNKIITRAASMAVASVVAFTSMPLTVLAADEPVTIESAQSDESKAESKVVVAVTAVNDVPQNNLTAEVTEPNGDKKDVSIKDVQGELDAAKNNLGAAKTNLDNASEAAAELRSEDENGNSKGLIQDAVGNLNDASDALNKDMQLVLEPETDEDGNIIYIDVVDENGNPVTDEDGNIKKTPKYKVVGFAEAAQKTEKGADGAISDAKTANTSDSETVARAAAGNAVNELNAAEAGLTAAGKDVDDAQQAVNSAEAKYNAAVKAANAAREKYKALQDELKNAQTNATAAHEHLKAAENDVKALSDKANDAYLEYIGAKDNEELQKLFGDVVDHFDKMVKSDGSYDYNEIDYLSLSLLEYYITTGKLVVYDYNNKDEEGNPAEVSYGSDFKVSDRFEVTLKQRSVPTNPTQSDVKYTEDGVPYINVEETDEKYVLIKDKGWEYSKVLEKFATEDTAGNRNEKNAVYKSTGFVYAGTNYADNRVVVTFKDKNGDDQVFYFNYKSYKNNGVNTIYIYQKLFSKVEETIEGNDKAVETSEGVYAGYKSFVNETGIKWENDVNPGLDGSSQKRAYNDGQLAFVDGKLSNSTEHNNHFDYIDAVNKKHLADKMNIAKNNISTANGETEKFSKDVDKLVADYVGATVMVDDEKKTLEPNNFLFGGIKEIDQSLASLKEQLDSAKATLAAALDKKTSLVKKFAEAEAAVKAIDLSRFNKASDADDDSDDDDDSSSGDAVIYTGTAATVTESIVGAGAGAVTVRTDRAVLGARKNTTPVANGNGDNVSAANSENKSDQINKNSDSKKITTITNQAVPLTGNVEAENSQFNALWLLAVLALAAVAFLAKKIYDDRKVSTK